MSSRKESEQLLSQTNLLDLAPIRIADWSDSGDRIVIHRPKRRVQGLRSLVDKALDWLAPARIRLDEVGTFAWQRLDGSTTAGSIAKAMRMHFGESVEPAEERLGKFIQMLRREGMLAYPGWDDEVTKDARGAVRVGKTADS